MPRADCFFTRRALTGADEECGDTGLCAFGRNECLGIVIDVLGHGPEAHEVAVLADAYLEEYADLPLLDLMEGLHAKLQGTRGCGASMCRLELETGLMQFCGVGNITCRIFSEESQRIIPQDGIIGYMMPTPKVKEVQLRIGDVVMLYSDGVKEHFEIYDHPGLLTGSARDVVCRVMNSFSKKDDDSSCLVLRYSL